MRDIIFKGKRKDNSEWVEGYLFDDGMVDSKRMFIGSLVITEHKGPGEDVWDIGHDFCEVIHETVGQYTGLTDKNGKKIFEGDIIKADNWLHQNMKVYTVVFEDGGFYAKYKDEDGWNFDHLGNIEVIGNIHDNKDLLEVK